MVEKSRAERVYLVRVGIDGPLNFGEWQQEAGGERPVYAYEGPESTFEGLKEVASALKEGLQDEGADETYELTIDGLPDDLAEELRLWLDGDPDIRGLVHNEPTLLVAAVYRENDGGISLVRYVGLDLLEASDAPPDGMCIWPD